MKIRFRGWYYSIPYNHITVKASKLKRLCAIIEGHKDFVFTNKYDNSNAIAKAAAISTIEPYAKCNTAKIIAEAHKPNFFNKNPLKKISSAKGANIIAKGIDIQGKDLTTSLTFA